MQPHLPSLHGGPDLGSLQSDAFQKTARLLQTLQQSLLRTSSNAAHSSSVSTPVGGGGGGGSSNCLPPLRRDQEILQSLLQRSESWAAQQQLQQLLQSSEAVVSGAMASRDEFDARKQNIPLSQLSPSPAPAPSLPCVGGSLGWNSPAGWEERMAVLKRLQEQRAELMAKMVRLQQRGDLHQEYAGLKQQLLKVASVESRISSQMSGVASIATSRVPCDAMAAVKAALHAGVYVPPAPSLPASMTGQVRRIVQRLQRRRGGSTARLASGPSKLMTSDSLPGVQEQLEGLDALHRRIQEEQVRVRDKCEKRPLSHSGVGDAFSSSLQLSGSVPPDCTSLDEPRSPSRLDISHMVAESFSSVEHQQDVASSSPLAVKRSRDARSDGATSCNRRTRKPLLSSVASAASAPSVLSCSGEESAACSDSSEDGDDRLPAKQRRLLLQREREEALQRRYSEAAAALRRERAQRQRRKMEREGTEAACCSDTASDSDTPRHQQIERKLYRRLKQLSGNALLELPHNRNRDTLFRDAHSLQEKLDVFIDKEIACQTIPNPCSLVNAYTTTARFRSENHRAMLGDWSRVKLFVKAINEKARGAKAVLEIGPGPFCLLSINAARAGARRVLALEVSRQSAYEAASFVRMYGFSDKIRVVNAFSKEADLERLASELRQEEGEAGASEVTVSANLASSRVNKRRNAASSRDSENSGGSPGRPALQDGESTTKGFDLIIHEIIGDICSNEGVADVVLDVQTRTGVVPKSVPFAARTWFCPCELPSERQIRFPHKKYPLRTLLSPNRVMLQSVGLRFHPLLLAENFAPLEELLFEEAMAPQMLQRRTAEFRCERSGKMAGLLLCNEVELLEGLSLDNRRPEEQTHWYTNVVLLREEVSVSEGDFVVVHSCADLKNYQVVDVPEGRGLADCADVKRNMHPDRAMPAVRTLRRQQKPILSQEVTSNLPPETTCQLSPVAEGGNDEGAALDAATFTPFYCPEIEEAPLQENWKRIHLSRPRFCFEVQIHRGGRLCDFCAERFGAKMRSSSSSSEWRGQVTGDALNANGAGNKNFVNESSRSSGSETSAALPSSTRPDSIKNESAEDQVAFPRRARDSSRPSSLPSVPSSSETRRRGAGGGLSRRSRGGRQNPSAPAASAKEEEEEESKEGEKEEEGEEDASGKCTCEGIHEDASGRPRFERLPLVVINYAEQSPHLNRSVRRSRGAAQHQQQTFMLEKQEA